MRGDRLAGLCRLRQTVTSTLGWGIAVVDSIVPLSAPHELRKDRERPHGCGPVVQIPGE